MKDLIYGVMGAAIAYAIPLIILLLEDMHTKRKERSQPKHDLRRIIIDRLETHILSRLEDRK